MIYLIGINVHQADPLQVSVAEKLQQLHEQLEGYEPPSLEFYDDYDKKTRERRSRIAKRKTDFLKVIHFAVVSD